MYSGLNCVKNKYIHVTKRHFFETRNDILGPGALVGGVCMKVHCTVVVGA